MIEERILELFLEENRALDLLEMEKLLEINKGDRKIFRKIIEKLMDEGHLVETKNKKYLPVEKSHLHRGVLQGNGRGFCYFLPEEDMDDVFIHSSKLHGAMHKDTVLIKITKSAGKKRSAEGEVVKIVGGERKTTGVLQKGEAYGFVVLDDKKYGFDVYIPKNQWKNARNMDHVVVEISEVPANNKKSPSGRIVEVLGNRDEAGVDLKAIAWQFGLPDEFPPKIKNKLMELPKKVTARERGQRVDLRDLLTVTIDGADAKDFDDAISLEKTDKGYLLWVHIADVAHYVIKNSAIDKEAERRGNSVYLLNRVIPMLPEELSNGICSLKPDEERLAVTVRMEINKKGKVLDHRFYESVIVSDHRLVYTDVSDFLEGDEEIFADQELQELLKNCQDLQKILRARRDQRGALDFDFPESHIVFDDQGKPIAIQEEDYRIANQIIEEFMLVTNETVGRHFGFMEHPFMYRVHEEPDETSVEELRRVLLNFGYSIKGEGTFSKDFQKILNQIKGKPEESLLSKIVLRTMKKAHYSANPEVHFGLATMFYSHFTAPIRRYSDLFIHRIVKDFINNRASTRNEEAFYDYIEKIADWCSKRERQAELAEREATDMKMAEYMEDHIGEEFEGQISSVTSFGIFVQLPNTVEGLVRYDFLDDDFYEFDEKNFRAIGQRGGKEFLLGQKVRVQLVNASKERREIDFMIIEEEDEDGGKNVS